MSYTSKDANMICCKSRMAATRPHLGHSVWLVHSLKADVTSGDGQLVIK